MWKDGCVIRNKAVSIFTDGSKVATVTELKIFSKDLELSDSLKVSDSCTVCEAKIYSILAGARRIGEVTMKTMAVDILV